MISIGSKNKILLFDVSTEGIDSENLEFWFRIYDENVSYSFKGELLEKNKVKIVILPLTEMINEKYLDPSKIYPAEVEVIGDGKYSLVTWEEEIKLEKPVKVDVKLETVQEEVDVVKNKIRNSKKAIKDNKTPSKIEVNISKVIEEDAKDESIEVKDSNYTRTSLLEDILGGPKKDSNVIEKINDLIKDE